MGDLTPGALADLELVCTELATNALEHAAGPRRMRIRRDRKAKAIRVEIDDASPDLLPAIGTSRVNEHRGRGLELVNALAHWGVQRDQRSKTLWAVVPAG
jgi:anti-sigma regulatory factor (Ser/Thr protein kinase)